MTLHRLSGGGVSRSATVQRTCIGLRRGSRRQPQPPRNSKALASLHAALDDSVRPKAVVHCLGFRGSDAHSPLTAVVAGGAAAGPRRTMRKALLFPPPQPGCRLCHLKIETQLKREASLFQHRRCSARWKTDYGAAQSAVAGVARSVVRRNDDRRNAFLLVTARIPNTMVRMHDSAMSCPRFCPCKRRRCWRRVAATDPTSSPVGGWVPERGGAEGGADAAHKTAGSGD